MRRAHNARMKILLFLGGRSLPKPSPLAGCFLGGLRPPKLSRWGWLANPWAGVAHPNAITPVGAHTFCPPLNPARGGGQNLSLQYISGAGASQRQPHTPLSRSGRGGQGGEDQQRIRTPSAKNSTPERGRGRWGMGEPGGCAPNNPALRRGWKGGTTLPLLPLRSLRANRTSEPAWRVPHWNAPAHGSGLPASTGSAQALLRSWRGPPLRAEPQGEA